MSTIHFNTGRLYTEAGQRITATLHDDNVVTFMDHSRGVDGEFKLCGRRFDESIVMNAYDHNISKGTLRSRTDGMYRGGCNAEYVGR